MKRSIIKKAKHILISGCHKHKHSKGGKSMRKGLPSHFAKMGFKKGWAAYKRSHRVGFEGSRRKGSRRRVHHSVMLDGDFSTPAIIQKPLRSISSITPKKVLSPIIDLGLLIIGMMVGAGAKKMSPIKNPHLMNGAQAVLGIGGSLMTKNRFIKMPLLGVALQGTISEANVLWPGKIILAGDDDVVYLPVGDEGVVEYPQIEMQGNDDRFGEVIGEVIGDDTRMGEVIGAMEDAELDGEGTDD
jgi:hypothetical protein